MNQRISVLAIAMTAIFLTATHASAKTTTLTGAQLSSKINAVDLAIAQIANDKWSCTQPSDTRIFTSDQINYSVVVPTIKEYFHNAGAVEMTEGEQPLLTFKTQVGGQYWTVTITTAPDHKRIASIAIQTFYSQEVNVGDLQHEKIENQWVLFGSANCVPK